jgi:DNA-binding MarR family transcriptional regulator
VPNRPDLAVDPIEEVRRQWRRRDWAAADEVLAVGSVMRVQQILLKRLEDQLKPYGLTFARYEALLLLLFSQQGALPLGKMGERLLVHSTSVTSTVDRLERQGYVRRVRPPEDRRVVLAEITSLGRKVALEATEALSADRFGLPGWSETDLDALSRQLGRIRRENADIVEGG